MFLVLLFLVILIPRTEQVAGVADVNILSIDETLNDLYGLIKDIVSFTAELTDMLTIEQKMKITVGNNFGDKDLLLVKSYQADRNNRGIERGGVFKNVGYSMFGDAFPNEFGTGHIRANSKATDEYAGGRGLGVVLVYQIEGTADFLHVLVEVRDMPQIRNEGDDPRKEIMKIFKDPFGVFELLMGSIFKGANKLTNVVSDLFLDLLGNANILGASPIPFDPKAAKKIFKLVKSVASVADISKNIKRIKKLIDKIKKVFPNVKGGAKGLAKKAGGAVKKGWKKFKSLFDDDEFRDAFDDDLLHFQFRGDDDYAEEEDDDISDELKQKYKVVEDILLQLIQFINHKELMNIVHKIHQMGTTTLGYGIFQDMKDHTKDLDCVIENRNGKHSLDKIPENVRRPVCTLPGSSQYEDWGSKVEVIGKYGISTRFGIDRPFLLIPETSVALYLIIFDKPAGLVESGSDNKFDKHPDSEVSSKVIGAFGHEKKGWKRKKKKKRKKRRKKKRIKKKARTRSQKKWKKKMENIVKKKRYSLRKFAKLINKYGFTEKCYKKIKKKLKRMKKKKKKKKRKGKKKWNKKKWAKKNKKWKRIKKKARTKSQKKWKKKIKRIAKKNRYPLKKVAMFVNKYGYTKKCYKKIKRKLKKMKKKKKKKRILRKARTKSQKKWKKKIKKLLKRKKISISKFKKIINKYGYSKKTFKKIKRKIRRMKKKKRKKKKSEKKWEKKINNLLKKWKKKAKRFGKRISMKKYKKMMGKSGYSKKTFKKIKRIIKKMKSKFKKAMMEKIKTGNFY